MIRLDENPTTGYRWAVESEEAGVFSPPSSEFIQAADAKTGAGGKRVFTFQSTKSGKASLRLKHWRSWQGDSSVISRFRVDIHVMNG